MNKDADIQYIVNKYKGGQTIRAIGAGLPDFNVLYFLLLYKEIDIEKLCIHSRTEVGIVKFASCEYFVKVDTRKNFIYRLKNSFANNSASRTWEVSRHLLKQNVATPICYYARSFVKKFMWNKTFLVLEKVCSQSLSSYYLRECRNDFATRIMLYEKAFSLLARIHNANVAHRDAQFANFYFVSTDKENSEIGVVDLDNAKIFDRLPFFERWNDFCYCLSWILTYIKDFKIEDEYEMVLETALAAYKKECGWIFTKAQIIEGLLRYGRTRSIVKCIK